MDADWSDENGNGFFDEGDAIIVTGHVFTAAYSGGPGGGGGGGSLGGLQDDAASVTPTSGDEALPAAEPLPTPCVETTFATPNVSLTDANRAALAASNVIAGLEKNDTMEFSSIVFAQDGRVGFTEPYTDLLDDRVNLLGAIGLVPTGAVILGIVHNHPDDSAIRDSIPSGAGQENGRDWSAYDQVVNWNRDHDTADDLPRDITVDQNMLLYIYTDEDNKTRVYDKTDKGQTRPSCALQ